MFNLFKKDEKKRIYSIKGMHCASCAAIIESNLEDAGFVAKCSYAKQTVEIKDTGSIDEGKIANVVKSAGYEVGSV